MKKKAATDLERVEFKTRAALRQWLSRNGARKTAIWCITWKKRPGAPHLPYDDIVEEALCFGWIDSLPRALDADRSMLLLSPRKPESNWSKLNKQRAERLIRQGLMAEAGLKLIAAAKANGRWSFLDDVEALTEPDDLARALGVAANARVHWDAFPRSAKRGILEWIKNAKTEATRAKRIAETASLAGKNIRANQYRQKLPGDGPAMVARTRGKPGNRED